MTIRNQITVEPDYVMLNCCRICYLGIKISDLFDWEQDQSIQSLTTISAGSAPAIQTNNVVCNGLDEVGAKAELKTNVSMDDAKTDSLHPGVPGMIYFYWLTILSIL